MKLVLNGSEGEAHFGILDDLHEQIPGLEIIVELDPDKALAIVHDADVVYGLPTAELIAAAPNLRWIQSSAAGVEYIARIPAVVESDVVVTNTRGAHGPSIGEHTFALLFALTRLLPDCFERQRQHRWDRGGLYRTAREIYGATMGIVGYGATGRAIAHRAAGFDMPLLAVDANPVPPDDRVADVWPVSRLGELLERSDVVVVTAPLTPETTHLIDAAMLARMQPTAYLIVVSRGGIVDETALADALKNQRLAGAGLDVVETEPLDPANPLWDAPNLVITPHMAGASTEKERRCIEVLRENLLRFHRGEPLLNTVDKRRGY
ncbi:MAG: D-2-hydroxyacid dehydrogenase [Thermomicrobiales bacterium]|nr:D-2-hydroxyacid dehydrogenase [Thermomicrobiales bacterium]